MLCWLLPGARVENLCDGRVEEDVAAVLTVQAQRLEGDEAEVAGLAVATPLLEDFGEG